MLRKCLGWWIVNFDKDLFSEVHIKKGGIYMKKLICYLNHNPHLMRIRDCNTENFENEDRAITVYKCKYCGKDLLVRTRFIKAKFNNAFKDVKDL